MRSLAFTPPCVALVLVLVLLPSAAGAHRLPGAPLCPVLPATSPWHQRVDRLPVAGSSDQLIARIGLQARVRPDFFAPLHRSEVPIGFPYVVVSSRTALVPVSFEWPDQSDPGPYPLPRGAPIEGGAHATGDRHVIVVDRDTCRDYELFDAYPLDGGKRWQAGAGAVFDLRSNQPRPAGWTSADAAGLPILPGLVRYDEVSRGLIDHALRFTAPCTAEAYVYPARHYSSTARGCGGSALPPMGLRVRLKRSVGIGGLPSQARVIAEAIKRYGMILADNGSSWHISGAPDARWNDAALVLLDRLKGRDFEVVDTPAPPRP